MISDLVYRLRALFFRRAVEAEMEDELRLHMERAAEKHRRAGLTAEEALRRARLDLGGVEQVREECRDARGTRWMEDALHDLRYALRNLRRSPIFAAVAVASLAIGIGANTAIFTMIDALLLKPLPVRDPQSLVSLGQGADDDSATYALWREVRQHQDIFSEMFAEGGAGDFDLAAGGQKQPAGGLYVSGSYFSALGVTARVGRTITEADDQRGAPPVAVLSYDFWRRHYAGDPNIVGRTIRLDNHMFEIVGVIERGFFGTYVGEMFEVAVPVAAEPLFHASDPYMDGQHYWWLTIFGRLKPGVDFRRASARLDVLMPPIFHALFPDDKRKPPYMVLKPAGSGLSYLRYEYSASLMLLMGMVGLVLLMACSNLANLLLARAGARSREVAVRLALGASRGRVVRLLLAESLLISVAGAALGVVLARGASGLMVTWISRSWERGFMNLAPDWRVLGFAAGLAVLTGMLCGLGPAARATRPAPQSALKEGTRGLTDSRRQSGFGRALVSVQVAISLLLVIGAGLFVRSLRELLTQDMGFRRDHMLLVRPDWGLTGYTPERRFAMSEQLLHRLRELPGVESAAASAATPIGQTAWMDDIEVSAPGLGWRKMHSWFNTVSPGFFETMGTPLLAGRDFTEHDNVHAPRIAIVNETAARSFFSGKSPLGQWYRQPAFEKRPEIVAQIVGVVKDAKYRSLRREAPPTIYISITQNPEVFYWCEVRFRGPVGDVIARVKEAARAADPRIGLDFRLLQTQIDDSLLRERLVARLASAFGVVALVLASLGLYGVVAYAVTRRRGEIGIRMALGSSARAVVWLMLRETAAPLCAGISLGLAAALVCGRFVRSMLFGLTPSDPITLGGACLVLLVVATAAAYVPARKAAGIDPLIALRDD